VIKKRYPLIGDSSGVTSLDPTESSEISSVKTNEFLDFVQTKSKSNNPSTDLYANDPSCQHILKWIHNDNENGLTNKDIMTEPLDMMHSCQHNLLNMGIVEFRPNQALTQVINHVLFKKTILLKQYHTNG